MSGLAKHFEITIPASTSNLGASFDTCGLALALYLRVIVHEPAERFAIVARGEVGAALPLDESNLIARVARRVAESRGRTIPGARLTVDSAIPLARGLGSSSAAIIAGVSVYERLSGERLSEADIFAHALPFEGHGDNLAPSLLGGLVVACVTDAGADTALITVRRAWPESIRIVLAIPDYELETARMRAVLPQQYSREDAIFNLQRAALLQAALSEGRLDLLSESLRDRWHQPFRAPLAPGLPEVLSLNDATAHFDGLLGVAISGAGSTVIAFATHNCDRIAAEMAARFRSAAVTCRTVEVTVDNVGRVVREIG